MIKRIHQVLKYNFPKKVRFWDGVERLTDRSIHKVFKHWVNKPSLRKESSRVYDLYQGGDFIDIGSYVGWYPILLAPKAKPGDNFVCFEPNPKAYPRLLQNLKALKVLFPHVNFWAIPQPVGNGQFVSQVAFANNTHPGFFSSPAGEDVKDVTVHGSFIGRTLCLDEICEAFKLNPGFIKVDVEGAEGYVLEGAKKTLKKDAEWLIELHPNYLPEGITIDQIKKTMLKNRFNGLELDPNHVFFHRSQCSWESPKSGIIKRKGGL